MTKPKKTQFLNAYHQKRSARLVKAIAAQPPMSREEVIAQVEMLKRQKDDFLRQNVVQTDPVTGQIEWSMWSKAPGVSGSLGHGVHYHDSAREPDDTVVAFIRGFGWQRSFATVQGFYIQPDAITSAEVIADLKQRIEALVAAREQHYRPETWITDRICARGNC